jgi:hypothetical protein
LLTIFDDFLGDIVMDKIVGSIEKISSFWKVNAIANNGGDPTFNLCFDKESPDFLEELLPFCMAEEWKNASKSIKDITLSYAWIIYNHKTIYIESDLILPVCVDIIKGLYVLDSHEQIQGIVAQAMVDEAVHTQMSINAANTVLKFRELAEPEYTHFFLTEWRNHLLSSVSTDEDKRLVALGIACASETLVTAYLEKIATAISIQRLCKEVTAAHASDELIHSGVFTLVLKNAIQHLSERERRLLLNSMYEAIAIFANKELGVWSCILSQIKFPSYKSMLMASSAKPDITVYTAGVERLLKRTGLAVK